MQDGSVVDLKQEEHSAIHHYITYSSEYTSRRRRSRANRSTPLVVTSEPALTFSSVYSTIRVYPITTGAHEDSTFIEWSATFSGDADAAAIQVCCHDRLRILQIADTRLGAMTGRPL